MKNFSRTRRALVSPDQPVRPDKTKVFDRSLREGSRHLTCGRSVAGCLRMCAIFEADL